MEKIPKILKLQAKVNQVFHSTVITWNKAILRNIQREVREDRSRGLNSQDVLSTEPQSLTVFFPEFFKIAESPELKLRNFATNRPPEPPSLSAVPKKESSYGYLLTVQKQI